MALLLRAVGILLLLVGIALGIYAGINFNDARRWDAMAEDKNRLMSLADIRESAEWSRSEVRYWGMLAAACAVPGVALLVVPGYLKSRQGG